MNKPGLVFVFVVVIGAIIFCYYRPVMFYVRDIEMPRWLRMIFRRRPYKLEQKVHKEVAKRFKEEGLKHRTRKKTQ